MLTLACLAALAVSLPQQPTPQEPKGQPAPAGETRPPAVEFDKNGWPVVPTTTAPAAAPVPWPSEAPPARNATPPPVTVRPLPAAGTGTSPAQPAVPSGVELGSPLLDVYQAVRSPGALRAMGGVTVWWRLTAFGPQGEPIGMRELTHRADLGHPERDRIEFADGRVYGRAGASVFAERQGMPWPTLAEAASHELALFGLLLRMPWCFGDGAAYAVMGRDQVQRGGETLTRLRIERRPDSGSDLLGPELTPRPRDRFELLCEASVLQPRELIYQLASSGHSRRMLLEDWREVGGVRMPFRRVLVDGEGRPTTVLEILRCDHGQAVTERDFRLR